VISNIFIVSQLKEGVILGIPFVKRHKCRIDFNKLAIMLAERELACVDRLGRPLVEGVQVVRRRTIFRRSWATVCCRVNCRKISD